MSRTVLITGGSSGLGAAVAHACLEASDRPFVLDLQPPGEGVEHLLVDLSDPEKTEHAVRQVVELTGGLDAVVTCAGTDACGRLEDVATPDWNRVVEVNLIGTAATVRAAPPSLRERRGRVVTVASTLGIKALSDATAYCASKFGVVGFTRALAAELAGEVGVTLLEPGGMQTAFFDGRPDQYKPGPDAVLTPPSEVARTVMFVLDLPFGHEIRELVVTASTEPSWP
ncbi:SDR family NAD(P)-dependent oxidoreductase [Aeromicrobium sp. Marseille-Q0843]|uniref:SDR family NAD(P)-dependent oxidoreductase n=1 Tax=Aeromicrobium phoceense TaxID=2754045 RepID=A0A838XJ23_9ACTN|nr:SDR family NAD(P)-dependent oxidoreductase [Aeromicrobium phoceense]